MANMPISLFALVFCSHSVAELPREINFVAKISTQYVAFSKNVLAIEEMITKASRSEVTFELQEKTQKEWVARTEREEEYEETHVLPEKFEAVERVVYLLSFSMPNKAKRQYSFSVNFDGKGLEGDDRNLPECVASNVCGIIESLITSGEDQHEGQIGASCVAQQDDQSRCGRHILKVEIGPQRE